ncbi:universal stress protein [Actinoplanes sp. NPDC048967]|uniref:universal stress protein n=1 Tax=Actinoplanes sp. NPDC048967 TaxID=3155269 RepID=UPI0033DB2BC0
MSVEAPAVVVGTDGSSEALAAVRWAAAQARLRGADLVIVHGYDEGWSADVHLPAPGFAELAAGRAAEIAEDAELAARAVAPFITIRRRVDAGQPGPVLLRAARHAALVVVGNRGHGGFAGLLLGSVGHAVATRAPCSVVVVRGEPDTLPGPVAVGVDGAAAGAVALECAFDQAAAEACPLEAIRAFLRPAPPWAADIAPSILWLEQGLAQESRLLAELVRPMRLRYPQVKVEELVSRADAARALVAASQRARLVVVGSRGLGPVAGMLLGSVGLQLLHHAACPVMIARGDVHRA